MSILTFQVRMRDVKDIEAGDFNEAKAREGNKKRKRSFLRKKASFHGAHTSRKASNTAAA